MTPQRGAIRQRGTPPPVDWRARFHQQAHWTQDLRRYLYGRAGVSQAQRVLEVGCGTGAITHELHNHTAAAVCGIDLDLPYLTLAHEYDRQTSFTCSNAARLPFPAGGFDAALCHFLLLWAHNPLNVLLEMHRVTRPGGAVLALAEPDYGARIDYPDELAELGQMQAEALGVQGADPLLGRKLGGLMAQAGLTNIETGLLGGQWSAPPSPEYWSMEWRVLEADLAGRIEPSRLAALRQVDWSAWQNGWRVLFVPTFYAWGRVPA
jgi:SAM-dependent methyltransferase